MKENEVDNFINTCIKACEQINYYINNNLNKNDLLKSDKKGEGGDYLSRIDLFSENIFISHLAKFGDIYSEESGLIKSINNKNKFNDYIIILDPIDGSDNLFSSFDYYSSAISLQKKICKDDEKNISLIKEHYLNNKISNLAIKNKLHIASIVYNLCSNKYVYKSIYSDNLKINAYNEKPKIALYERLHKNFEVAKMFSDNGIKLRNCGSVALSLANVRSYLFFLLLGERRIFDIAASVNICDNLFIYNSKHILFVSAYENIFNKFLPKIKQLSANQINQ